MIDFCLNFILFRQNVQCSILNGHNIEHWIIEIVRRTPSDNIDHSSPGLPGLISRRLTRFRRRLFYELPNIFIRRFKVLLPQIHHVATAISLPAKPMF